MNRRTLIFAGGVTVSVALAGCTSNSDDGSGPENDDKSDGGTGDEGDDDTPDADETQSDDGTDENGGNDDDAGDQPAPQTVSGTGSAVESVSVEGGLTVVESEHHGSDTFRVRLRDEDGASAPFVDDAGAYEGAKASLLEAGTYTVDVEADGDWRIEVRQPRATAADADALPQTVSDEIPAVVGPFAFDGSHSAAAEHDGEGYFQVRIFPEAGTNPEMVILEKGEYEGETTFSYDGVGWIDVDADGPWSLDLE